MNFLLLALKSLLIAAASLLLLRLMRNRSAAQRSTVAHLGLIALLLVPVSHFALPAIALTAPRSVTAPLVRPWEGVALLSTSGPPVRDSQVAVALQFPWRPLGLVATAPGVLRSVYLLAALILLAQTFVAMLGLMRLRTRAEVLVDPLWLTALARAQRRLNFKSGTALLMSRDLNSPISWGVMRPTILLDEFAARAPEHAEAVIAHELAHVANLDWAKLILSRTVTAMSWFNPLAWMLASEAYQLREEAADDAVIAAGVAAPDYAQLLVGLVRTSSNRAWLSAHAVAPPKNALHRRVSRILDHGVARGRSGWLWGAGCGLSVLGLAGPLSALTVTPELPPASTIQPPATRVDGAESASASRPAKVLAARSPAPMPSAPPRPTAANAPAPPSKPLQTIDADEFLRMRAAGITQAYRQAMAQAGFPDLTLNELIGTHSSGITPEYAHALLLVGMPANFSDLMSARALGLEPDYIATMRELGITGTFGDFRTLWSVHITPTTVRDLKAKGVVVTLPRQLLALRETDSRPRP